MFSRAAKVAFALALLQICGGHWAALQTAAWVGMIVSYTQAEASLPAALGKTFDGQHPCALCKAVTTGRSEERKQETTKLVVKLDAVLLGRLVLPEPAPHAEHCYRALVEAAARRSSAPISPPPQLG